MFAVFFIGCATTPDTIEMPKFYHKINNNDKDTSPHHRILKGTGFYKSYNFGINHTKSNSNIKKSSSRNLNFFGSGYIKGIVQKVYYLKNKHKWVYYIKGTNFANNKLKYAKVYSSKQIAHLNDFVYAVINDGFITSLYIYNISKSYKIEKKRKFVNKSKLKRKVKNTPKTRRREQIINAPLVEKIIF